MSYTPPTLAIVAVTKTADGLYRAKSANHKHELRSDPREQVLEEAADLDTQGRPGLERRATMAAQTRPVRVLRMILAAAL